MCQILIYYLLYLSCNCGKTVSPNFKDDIILLSLCSLTFFASRNYSENPGSIPPSSILHCQRTGHLWNQTNISDSLPYHKEVICNKGRQFCQSFATVENKKFGGQGPGFSFIYTFYNAFPSSVYSILRRSLLTGGKTYRSYFQNIWGLKPELYIRVSSLCNINIAVWMSSCK